MNEQILKNYSEIDKINDNINNKILSFINKANELIELSEDDYQLERTLRLNKISLKGFILDSPCCISLHENNITDYSIEELKLYLTQYEKKLNEDCSKYFSAISLYELIEDIEKQVNSKIKLEINSLSKIITNITDIEFMERVKYKEIYFTSKNKLDDYLKDSELDENTYNICVDMLNDIFSFYINGYPNIPDEYLYKNNDSQ